MRTRLSLLLALLGLAALLAGVALVQHGNAPDPYSRASLGQLLRQPLQATPGAAPRDGTPFWRALLESPAAERTAAGVTLRLGSLLADPTAARASALAAGELLELEALGPQGGLGIPLWRAILDGPALQDGADGAEPTLRIYGCRHSADAGAGPALEDTYHARLSLARALRGFSGLEPGSRSFTLLGEESPVKGGVNFEVQLVGEVQGVAVTFDGHRGPPLHARRAFPRRSPADARARASLVAALRELAAAERDLGSLTIEGETSPAEGGADLRIEIYGDRLALTARCGESRLATHVALPGQCAGSR